jgi:hypothetical protein
MIWRIAALVGMTIAYWLCALVVLGALAMGDCFENRACADAKQRAVVLGAVIAVGLYLAVTLLAGWALFRRRAD